MDARELRIGNYVGLNLKEFPHNLFTVHEVAEHNMSVYCGINKPHPRAEKHFYDADFLEGIPLTEEWLIKFGFEKIAGCFDDGKLSILLEKSIAHPKGRVFYNSWCIGEEAPLHVHQLQNLYFALTGQELTINEK